MDTAKIARMLGVTPHPKLPNELQVNEYMIHYTGRGAWITYPTYRQLYETEEALYRELFRLGLITTPLVNEMIENAEWSLDCHDKQNFDFNVLSVDTRYYPDFSAYSSIYLRLDKHGTGVNVREKQFKSDSESATKQLVEDWLKTHLAELLTRLTQAGDLS